MTNGSRMPPLEHSAILLTCIKRLLVLKSIFDLFESGLLTQVLQFVQVIYLLKYVKHVNHMLVER